VPLSVFGISVHPTPVNLQFPGSILGVLDSNATREYWTLSPGPVSGLENSVGSGCSAVLPSGQTGW